MSNVRTLLRNHRNMITDDGLLVVHPLLAMAGLGDQTKCELSLSMKYRQKMAVYNPLDLAEKRLYKQRVFILGADEKYENMKVRLGIMDYPVVLEYCAPGASVHGISRAVATHGEATVWYYALKDPNRVTGFLSEEELTKHIMRHL